MIAFFICEETFVDESSATTNYQIPNRNRRERERGEDRDLQTLVSTRSALLSKQR